MSDHLWEAVRTIQTASNPRREAVRLGAADRRRHRYRSKYLLGGTLMCGSCGCNYIGDNAKDYLCPAHTVGSCDNDLRFSREDVHRAVITCLADALWSDDALARGRARLEEELLERARAEEVQARSVQDRPEIRRLDQQAAVLRGLRLPESARTAALAAIDRERDEIIRSLEGNRSARGSRARRLLARLPEIVAESLAQPDVVAEAAESLRRLLEDG